MDAHMTADNLYSTEACNNLLQRCNIAIAMQYCRNIAKILLCNIFPAMELYIYIYMCV